MFQNLQGSQLLIEPLVGYRCFQVRSADGTLFSMNNTLAWPDQGGLHAVCIRHVKCPDKFCSCGIYASKSMEWLVKQRQYWPLDKEWKDNDQYTSPRLVVAVHLWGLVQQYTEGYRAEWAQPVVVYHTPKSFELAKVVAKKYGAMYEPRPKLEPPPDEEEEQQRQQLNQMRAAQAQQRKEQYLKKREAQKQMLAEAMKRGFVDARGNLTAAGQLYLKQKGGGTTP